MFSIVSYFFLFLTFVFVKARIEAPSAASSVDSSVDTTASVDEGISDLSTHETIINPSTGNEKSVFDEYSLLKTLTQVSQVPSVPPDQVHPAAHPHSLPRGGDRLRHCLHPPDKRQRRKPDEAI